MRTTANTRRIGIDSAARPGLSMPAATDDTDLRLVLDKLGDGLWDWNTASGDVYFSPGWAAMLGFHADEITNRLEEWESRIHPDDRDQVYAELDRHITGAADRYVSEHRLRCKDGSFRWVLDRGVIVDRNADGSPRRMIGIHTDITDRKTAEGALAAAARFQRVLIDTIPLPVFVKNRQGRYVDVNAGFADWCGRAQADLIGRSVADIAAPDLAGIYCRADEALLTTGDTQTYTAKARGGDGVEREIEFRKAVFLDETGAVAGLVGAMVDMSARRAAEQALIEQTRFYEQVFVASPAVKLLIEPGSGRIIDANLSAARFYGYDRERLRTMKIMEINALPADAVRAEMERALEKEQSCFEFRHRLASGEVRDVEVYSGPLNVAGAPLLMSLVHDVTERNRARAALQRQTAELERSNAELEAFAYVASHDLRQPLRTISSYLAVLEEDLADRLDGECRTSMDFCRDSAQRMDRLIVDLLAYSRIGRRTRPFAALDAGVVLEAAVQSLALDIRDSRVDLTLPAGPPPRLRGDEGELERLFQNLIGNAVKYRTPDRPARVAVDWRVEGTALHVTVTDNGIGIAAEHFTRIFGIFQRLHSRDVYDGTGIGLAICKKIVEHHGGSIGVESTPGAGTTFHIHLPLAGGAA
ncbi:MAG: hypothetical protein RLY86_532 [Pseudomonadota bacterium]